ncbi:hypothetical protein BN381_70064 [Candidatus Microthrix parvicella RN1]|uniref:Uncharacterized protein n=1 Tax=Candidatus Neomicrothrix parvicella RN1 TaxID=1229780 RepID=R4Z3X7_9ACTN|nr:hypothetical protein BN381_70064 [Candidatus Microthrix parvicella RN1]
MPTSSQVGSKVGNFAGDGSVGGGTKGDGSGSGGSEWLDVETLSEGPRLLRVLANAPGRGEVSVSATFAVRPAVGE